MRARTFRLAAVLFAVGIVVAGTSRAGKAVAWTPSAITERSGLAETLKRLPRHFEEHRDADGRVRFVSRTPESTVVLSGDGATLTLPEARPVHMRLAGGHQSPNAVPSEELTGKTHYLIGSDPARWRTDVRTFAKVRFAGVYPGVDLVYYARGRELEYDFIVAPAADPARIRLRFDDVDSLGLDDDGGLRLRIGSRDIRMEPPHLYQEATNGRQTIDGRYRIDGPREVRFEVGAYDRDRQLVIDPVVTYSTYFGGGGEDVVTGIAVDDDGFIYFTGTTPTFGITPMYPSTPDAYQPVSAGGSETFVTKLSPDGRTIVYSTFFGGPFTDTAHAIAVDRHGRVYIAGTTGGHDFPIVNPVQPTCAGREDAFVAKLNARGSALEYSTCLGGTDSDEAFALAIDDAGNAYVTGYARSKDFPTHNAVQPVHGNPIINVGTDAFVSVIAPHGSELVYSTFLGGTGGEEGRAIAVDRERNVYVTGGTNSLNFPVVQAFQPQRKGAIDAFVTRMDRHGSIVYSTYFGGDVGLSDDGVQASGGGDETGLGIAVDRHGNAYVTGQTNSSDLPTLNAAQPHLGGPQHPTRFGFTRDAFLAKFDPAGTPLLVTYAGGSGNDEGTAIAVDEQGGAWITGRTESANFPTVRPTQPAFGDGLVFSSANAGATWTVAAGGVTHRNVSAVAVDPTDASIVYAATFGGGVFKSTDGGHTWSATNNGLSNLFVQGFAVDPLTPTTLFAATDGGGVFKSSDGGATWAQRLGPAPTTKVVIDPINPSNVYAGAAARGFGAVFRSHDGGETWEPGVFTGLVNDLAIDPITPSTLYAATNSGIFKSTDGGLTFVLHRVTTSPDIVSAVAVDPTSPSTVYAGLANGPVLKSIDGGVTWEFRFNGLFGGEVHQLAVDAAHPFTVYAATDTGLFKTIDGADHWAGSKTGVTTRTINAVAINPHNPDVVHIGAFGTNDVFVIGFRRNGSIRYSSFVGGTLEDFPGGIAVGRHRRVYLSGTTNSRDFPTVDPIQPASAGPSDAFVTIVSRIRDRRHHR